MADLRVLDCLAAMSQADTAREVGDAAAVGSEFPSTGARNVSRPLSSGRDAAVSPPSSKTHVIDWALNDALDHARFLAARKDPAAIYELHSQVSRLATNRRRGDPKYIARLEGGRAAAQSKIHAPPRYLEALT